MDDWLTIVLAVGLAVRITRLITLDSITQPIRDRLGGFFGALTECPWCTGVWVGAGVGLSWWAWSGQTWWQVTALIALLAWASGAAAGVGMPSQHEVATVSPIALINADEPAPQPEAEAQSSPEATEAAIVQAMHRQREADADIRVGGSD